MSATAAAISGAIIGASIARQSGGSYALHGWEPILVLCLIIFMTVAPNRWSEGHSIAKAIMIGFAWALAGAALLVAIFLICALIYGALK